MARETIGQAWVEVVPDTQHFGREAENGVTGALKKVAGVAAGAFAAVGVTRFVGSVIGAASDMNETLSKVGVVFEESADDVTAWAANAATQFGQSKQQALDAASTFAVFGKSAGLTGADLQGFSTRLVETASDMASFHNADPSEVIEALGAGLRGEAEPLRRFGILLDDATLRQKALEMGIITSTKDALLPNQKVLAAQAVIMGQVGDAAGDFSRTSDGLANQQRILSAQWEDSKTKLGQGFLPIALKVVSFLNDNMVPAVGFVIDGVKQMVAVFKGSESPTNGLGQVIGALGDAARAVAAWFVENWPTIQATVEEVGERVGAVLGWLSEEVVPRVIAAVRTAVEWVRENWPEFRRIIAESVQWINDNVVPLIRAIVAGIIAKWREVVEWTRTHWDEIKGTVQGVINIIRTIVTTVIEAIRDAWGAWGDNLTRIASTVWGGIKAFIESTINVIKSIIQTVTSLIRGDWEGVWEGIKGIVTGVWDGIKATVSTAVGIVKETIGMAWTSIKAAAGIAWDGLKSIVSTAVDSVVGYVRDIPGRLLGALGAMVNAASSLGGAIVDGIADGLRGVAGVITRPIKSAWNAVATLWNNSVGKFSFTIPSWVPGVGGKGFNMPDLPRLHTGGIVPGPRGAERPYLLRAGEEVITETDRAIGLGGSGRGPLVRIDRFVAAGPLDVQELGAVVGWALASSGAAA